MKKSKGKFYIKNSRVKMREYWDEDCDILDFYWGKKRGVEHSKELNVTMVIDFDKKDNIIGIEIWDFFASLRESQKRIDKMFKKSKKRKKNETKD